MIKPCQCGPLTEYEINLMNKAEAEIDCILKEHYNPNKKHPVRIDGPKTVTLRVHCHRAFDELIHKYENIGWKCVWIPNAIDGMTAPFLVEREAK